MLGWLLLWLCTVDLGSRSLNSIAIARKGFCHGHLFLLLHLWRLLHRRALVRGREGKRTLLSLPGVITCRPCLAPPANRADKGVAT